MDVLFLGGTGTVTGSKFLVGAGSRRVLVDCGLFQGYKQLRERNWQPLPVDLGTIDRVVLTHAHVDHSGWLPVLVKRGFHGPVHCTEATRDLCEVLLRDSARLHEEEAEYLNRKGKTTHAPALPLFTEQDAEKAVRLLDVLGFHEPADLGDGLELTFTPAGHILGAAFVSLRREGRHLLFSGDLGRPGMPILKDPETVTSADWLVLESTYGNRRHDEGDPRDQLAEVIGRTIARGGTVLIPSFAVARAQQVILFVQQLKDQHRIPDVPVYLNSPMALDVTRLYVKHHALHRLSAEECARVFSKVTYVKSVEESKALNADTSPKVVISSSGMATGGRVLHHLKALAPDARNAIVFVGFQAAGTLGRRIVDGAKTVRLFGEPHAVRAKVFTIGGLSAHADRDALLGWAAGFRRAPRQCFVVHGEPLAAHALRDAIVQRFGWRAEVPALGQTVAL